MKNLATQKSIAELGLCLQIADELTYYLLREAMPVTIIRVPLRPSMTIIGLVHGIITHKVDFTPAREFKKETIYLIIPTIAVSTGGQQNGTGHSMMISVLTFRNTKIIRNGQCTTESLHYDDFWIFIHS